MNPDRPNPEALLEAVTREEERSHKGRLKIFLGMAAGVGKTFGMLEEAQQRHQEGLDVVVGLICTHGRLETEHLLKGLKSIPERIVSYKGKNLSELDIDEILRRKPQLVLIDELAHTNIPESRHLKRWQDVLEILEAGIDVYTTLNVQHIESLKEVIERITDTTIRESVPDLVIERAESIQLIDLTPKELLDRLKEGKVYLGNQSKIAAEHFFQADRLTALREIVLRFTAEKVDYDLHAMISSIERTSGWKPRERLLVAVSHSPHSQRLIRTTRRLAFNLGAPWIALHIDNGRVLNEVESVVLARNLALARDLGAEVMTISDPDIVDGIQRMARQRSVTQIIIGRPPHRGFWDFFMRFQLLDRLARECTDVDIHVIRQNRVYARGRQLRFSSWEKVQILPYFAIMAFVLMLGGVNWLLLPWIGYKVVGVVFLIGILFLSLFFRMGPIILASLMYALMWDYFFIPPVGTFTIGSSEDMALLTLYVITAVVTGILTDRGRQHKELLAKREESSRALYEIVRHIASAPSKQEILQAVEERLGLLFDGKFAILSKGADNELILDRGYSLLSDEKDRNAALWVFEKGCEAGRSTSTLPSINHFLIPLRGYNSVVGVLVFHPKTDRILTSEDKSFLYAVGQQLANYLDRTFAEEKSRQSERRSQVENVYQTVLKLVSQQMKKPLTVIEKALNDLSVIPTGDEGRRLLTHIFKIEDASDGLFHALDNVSAMARLLGGLVSVQKRTQPIGPVIDACVQACGKYTSDQLIIVRLAEELELVPFDFGLVKMLLLNVLLYAIENTASDSTIEVTAVRVEDDLVLSVAYQRAAVLLNQHENNTSDHLSNVPGMGTSISLGIAVAKRIAELHHGQLKIEDQTMGGTLCSFILPIEP